MKQLDHAEKIIEKSHRILSIFWYILFLLNALFLFYVLTWASKDFSSISSFRTINNIYTIGIVVVILLLYLIKKNKFNPKILNNIIEQKKSGPIKVSILIPPIQNEDLILNGITYYIRKYFTYIYLLLLVLFIGNAVYYFVTFDRRGFYMFFIVTLFSLFVNYPRKYIWEKIKLALEEQEEDHDSF